MTDNLPAVIENTDVFTATQQTFTVPSDVVILREPITLPADHHVTSADCRGSAWRAAHCHF